MWLQYTIKIISQFHQFCFENVDEGSNPKTSFIFFRLTHFHSDTLIFAKISKINSSYFDNFICKNQHLTMSNFPKNSIEMCRVTGEMSPKCLTNASL
jgi:hypothetical protein